MKPGNFKVSDEGNNLSAIITVKPSLALKASLYLLNSLIIAVILLFAFGGIGVITLFIVAFEVLFLRYSIWNLYGSEYIILNRESISHQLHYGPIKLPVRTVKVNSIINVIPFNEDFRAGSNGVKVNFESLDDKNEPVNLFQTSLVISREDYKVFMQSFNRMFSKA
ncbi:hypothetical protein [Pedobacter nyackensis]|uniref:Uncharacterized protein n=1 Tax=Pedobacter nyackensis TaxID=475255 RepID=A0A1W2ET23_9SPHI|nr:hypothetical protein [Pedobacter nyackensis]SMD12849.1 hypothetical protein SAMN04488101_115112 [Pedobacter nyackensis]